MIERISAIRTLPVRGEQALRALLERPGMRLLADSFGSLALGAALAGASIAGQPLPLAVCLVGAAASPLRGLSALLGGSLGYIAFWGLSGGLEYVSVGALVFSALCIAGNAEPEHRPWLMPALTAALSLLVGLLFLAQARFAPGMVVWRAGGLLLAAVTVWAYARARAERDEPCLLYLLMGVLSGLSAVALGGGVTLGQIAAAAVGAAAVGTPRAILLNAAAGLAIDLAVRPQVSLTALLCFAGLAAAICPLRLRPARILVYLGAVLAGVLFTGGRTPELVPAASVGCCLSLLIPSSVFFGQDGRQAARRRLEEIAQLLSEIGGLLDEPDGPPESGAAAVFDRATDLVCGRCVMWSQCWQRRSDETYRALCAVAGPMLERGEVLRADFPPDFVENCCRLDELMAAVDRELEGVAGRRQLRSRLKEQRTVLSEQYGFLSELLRRTAGDLRPRASPELRYTPELGTGAAGKGGSPISGDRGACFQTEDGRYYLLLCDGMGTGADAEAESRRAIRTLAGLLRAGQEPRQALETLNGVYILRGDGSFSTVDLLEASLVTGQATLYKWGAAPSYFKNGKETKKLGTAAPPPGFGVGEAHKAEEFRLSLREGELLVLLSDGAGGEEAGKRIAAWGDGAPKSLAAALIGQVQSEGEDDRTAVALRLRRRSSGIA